MGNHDMGKLKHSTKDKCPECGNVLQVRVKELSSFFNGIPLLIEEEYIACSNPSCYYEDDIKVKRRKLKEKDIMPKKPKRDFRRQPPI